MTGQFKCVSLLLLTSNLSLTVQTQECGTFIPRISIFRRLRQEDYNGFYVTLNQLFRTLGLKRQNQPSPPKNKQKKTPKNQKAI